MPFIQIIEFSTSRPDEVESLMDDWLAKTKGKRTAQRSTLSHDRDRPNRYVQIVEFPSYEDAMTNSDLPETAAISSGLAELCDGPPEFRNLDVRRVDDL